MGCHDRTELWVSSGVQIAIWISIRSPLVHTTHDTKYTRSVRLGWDQPDMSVRSMVWLGHGVLEEEREREALGRGLEYATVAENGRP